MEQVNHPKHYNQHSAGIECIDVIRHYTCDIANALKYLWRAGLKGEIGKEAAEKEIEDLKKALWYIEDYQSKILNLPTSHFKPQNRMMEIIYEVTGHPVYEIGNSKGYDLYISNAIGYLLLIGIISQGEIRVDERWGEDIRIATDAIQHRIVEIEAALTRREMTELKQALHGQPIDGEDYVSKPGGVRETEPDQYDPLNMVVAWGRAYSLSSELRKKPNGAFYTPCQNCALMDVCYDDWRHPEESQCHNICRQHGAADNQYYREVGVAKYSPTHGTLEVVDEMKESELELKRLDEED